MYRLARRFGLTELRQASLDRMKRNLQEDNIVCELFSQFTSRYAEVIEMQIDFFCQVISHPTVRRQTARVLNAVALGRLPHSDAVLSVFFLAQKIESVSNTPIRLHPVTADQIRSALYEREGDGGKVGSEPVSLI